MYVFLSGVSSDRGNIFSGLRCHEFSVLVSRLMLPKDWPSCHSLLMAHRQKSWRHPTLPLKSPRVQVVLPYSQHHTA